MIAELSGTCRLLVSFTRGELYSADMDVKSVSKICGFGIVHPTMKL